MKYSGSLDANILLRWLLDDIPEQAKIADKLIKVGKKFFVSDLAIIEVAFILEKHLEFSRELVVDNIQQIINHPAIQSNATLFEWALPHFLRKPKLSIVDCCLAGYATLNQATPLYTFDKKLVNQMSQVETPSE